MFKLDLLKNIRQKGAMFVEYALILAFVIAVGVIFLGEGGFKNSIASIFGQTNEKLQVAVNGKPKFNNYHVSTGFGWINISGNMGYYSNGTGEGQYNSSWLNSVTSNHELIPLNDGAGTYKIDIDYNAMISYLKNEGINVDKDTLKNYFTGQSEAGAVNIGMWAITNDNKVSSTYFKSDDGNLLRANGQTVRPGDSGEVSLQWLANETSVKYYTIDNPNNNLSLSYNVVNKDSATAVNETYQSYNQALINAGLVVSKVQ